MSTWGTLRLSLQTSAPGVPLDLVDEYLNSVYFRVLKACDWSGLHYHATIQTTAAYQSGTDTVTLTVGSAAVTGAGTAWTSGLIGQRFYRPGDTVIYTVATVPTGTSLTLDRLYEGNGVDAAGKVYAASAYVYMQNVYALPSDVQAIESILSPSTNEPLGQFSKANLDASAGPRTLIGDPAVFAPYDDSNEQSPPVLQQVEFYPPPQFARGFVMAYIHAATKFDGSSTGGSPLPFVSDSVILNGARALMQLHLKDYNAARLYQATFDDELAAMLRQEHQQRRTRTPIQMASRFTRHRLARASRGMTGWRGGTPGGAN